MEIRIHREARNKGNLVGQMALLKPEAIHILPCNRQQSSRL